ncbi:Uu.00g124110.m01.CDS01 [Anthostomella pinea]|uniref:Uu.00g124110.m01.CDS01 n=1 Tax=Anthostomella pinea TaxID=933095 RepID=A0AAI8VC86_9PEZI|nr:Uu.00g124110.m01.CDS01 [Anthostomella pinea]
MAKAMKDECDVLETFDVVIIGAGISGINCAYRIQSQLPGATFTVLENRDDLGGTWDLFKYPGVRSDSNLRHYSFAWHPWPYQNPPIADGPLIKQYLKDSVSQHGIDRYLRFGHKVVSTAWSSKSQQWKVKAIHDGVAKEFRAQFLVLGTGYYDYQTPRQTVIPGLEDFKGEVVHPQFWPEDFDYTGKKLAVIGSGATTVTLLPNLAKKAAQAVMVQRSPTYIAAMNNRVPKAPWMQNYLPASTVKTWTRLSYMVKDYLTTVYCHYFPKQARALFRKMTIAKLPQRIDYDRHFTPRYNPWEQRVCLSPDGDFFQAFHNPNTDIVTGKIETVTKDGIQMEDGTIIPADCIVTATGLTMVLGGGIDISVDGQKLDWGDRFMWNGAMVEEVPNMVYMMGYVNHSWTLGADDTAHILIRVMKNMQRNGVRAAVPRVPEGAVTDTRRTWKLSSTYSQEAESRLPRSGSHGPWRPKGHVPLDYLHARWGDVTTGLHYSA